MFIRRLASLIDRILIRILSGPLSCLGFNARCEVVARLAATMEIPVPTPRGTVRFYCPSPLLAGRARNLLAKEPDTIRWIDGFPEGAVFWDVGANVGVFTLYAAMKQGTRVLAFEPGAGNYQALCRNIQLNGFGLARAYCIAFSDCTRLGVLNLESAETGTALNQFGDPGSWSRYSGTAGGVQQGMIGHSIDDFVAVFNPPFPQFLKLDVDGIEWAILRGAEQTLRDPRLRSLLVELDLSDRAEHEHVTALLEDCGFRLSGTGEPQTAAGGAGRNHVFSKNEKTTAPGSP